MPRPVRAGGGGEVRRPGLLPLAGLTIMERPNITPHRRNVSYLLALLGARVDQLLATDTLPQLEK